MHKVSWAEKITSPKQKKFSEKSFALFAQTSAALRRTRHESFPNQFFHLTHIVQVISKFLGEFKWFEFEWSIFISLECSTEHYRGGGVAVKVLILGQKSKTLSFIADSLQGKIKSLVYLGKTKTCFKQMCLWTHLIDQ